MKVFIDYQLTFIYIGLQLFTNICGCLRSCDRSDISYVATFTNQPYVGRINFDSIEDKIHIKGSVNGFVPDSEHGVHIHEYGDLGENCLNAGSHYNPENKFHGDLDSDMRHAGDLGNIKANNDGVLTFDLCICRMELEKENGILGRSIVIHALKDDLGKTGDQGSLATGNSGARLACATIGLAKK